MSGKQHKREVKRARDAAREAARRKERQRNLYTVLVVAAVLLAGGAIIATTLIGERNAELAAASATPTLGPETDTAAALPPVDPCVPDSPPGDPGDKPTFPGGPDQVLDDGENYRAVVETTCGRMVFQLLEDDAPETVNSFVFLAEQGFYDGLSLFRNSTGIQILQGGAGTNEDTFDIGYELPDELGRAQAEGGYGPGALALAKGGPDSGGSQFFLVYGDSPLPPEYTLFGQLVEGLDVLRSIGAVANEVPDDPANEVPSTPVTIESITIERVEGEPAGPLAPVDTPAPEATAPAPAPAPAPTPVPTP